MNKPQQKPSTSNLFAEGVDLGVELALHWMEEELKRSQLSQGAIRPMLMAIRTQAQFMKKASFTRSVLRAKQSVRRQSASRAIHKF